MKRLLVILSAIMLVNIAGATTLSLSDDELSTEFAHEWGPGSVTITDTSGPGVTFSFSGLSTSSGTIVGDDFPVSQKAGGAYKDYDSGFATYGDFTGYSKYSLKFTNTGDCPLVINLKMNTGWTNSPWGTPARDTFWQNTWTSIGPGETKIVTLDFSSAEVYNAADDPNPDWRHPDGTTGVQVRRLDEVSDIGIQVLSGSDNCDCGELKVEKVEEEIPAPEFGSLAIAAVVLLSSPAFAYLLVRKRH
ncbi:MAG: hypothetical protein B5M53_07165 [Candidatus Cloacimonas sp. 4484_209]|nr:MAG: hypothetical protein B5M53_07165 [Candidatus Cloacimonas sp. 4484_209]